MANPIPTENALAGSTIAVTGATVPTNQSQLQAYLDKPSYNPGDTITFYVSVDNLAANPVTVNIYRLGYYAGNGGSASKATFNLTASVQGYYDFNANQLNNCPTAYIDSTTNYCEAGWAASGTFTIPSNWVSGIYVIWMHCTENSTTYWWSNHFVVKDPTNTARYVLVHPDITEQVYNPWGGASGYLGNNGSVSGGVNQQDFAHRAYKVSFHRPLHKGGTGDVLTNEVNFIKWCESQGYWVRYLSDRDVHTQGEAAFAGASAVLFMGHTEYWSYEMRAAVEQARDADVSLAFLGANACYAQVRMEADHAGTPNQTITCYKAGPAYGTSNTLDPYYSIDQTRLTTIWRDPILGRPEAALIGVQWSSAQAGGSNSGWTVAPGASSSLLSGTGLVNGTTYGTDLVGYEVDNQQAGSPANLNIIAASAFTATDKVPPSDTSHTTTYVATSGALVFASGSMDLTWGLDSYRRVGGSVAPIAGLQAMFANLMTQLALHIGQVTVADAPAQGTVTVSDR